MRSMRLGVSVSSLGCRLRRGYGGSAVARRNLAVERRLEGPRRSRSSDVRRAGADLIAGAAVRLRGTVLRDCAVDFLARRRFGVVSFRGGQRAQGFPAEVLADDVFDQDREQFRLTERRVWLLQRMIGGVPHLPLLLEGAHAAG